MPLFESGLFAYTSCQPGAEAALKKEIAREHPELKFAFSRPGFVTFKRSPEVAPLTPDFELKSVFARAYGVSVAKFTQADGTPAERAAKVLALFASTGANHLHVWERDQYAPGEEPKGFIHGLWVHGARKEFEKSSLPINQAPTLGDRVLDLVVVDEDSTAGKSEWFVGTYVATQNHHPAPGAKPELKLPPEAPSRAYLKLEEAILWSGAPIQSGDTAVEIGSAPGGAVYSLLKRGLTVVGIDPGAMDPVITRNSKYRHIGTPVAEVRREDLPDSVEWLLLDMNVAPQVSLFAVDRLASRMLAQKGAAFAGPRGAEFKDSLLGVLLTVKLNEWSFADQIPEMLAHLRAMGMARVRATQLASNKQEVFIYGITPQGVTRLTS